MTNKRNFVGGGGCSSSPLGNLTKGTSVYNAEPETYGVRPCL